MKQAMKPWKELCSGQGTRLCAQQRSSLTAQALHPDLDPVLHAPHPLQNASSSEKLSLAAFTLVTLYLPNLCWVSLMSIFHIPYPPNPAFTSLRPVLWLLLHISCSVN